MKSSMFYDVKMNTSQKNKIILISGRLNELAAMFQTECSSNLFLQDYNWWWRSFLTSGFTAFYLAIYCVHYFITKLEIEGLASTFLYLGYTSIMVFTFFLMTGKSIIIYQSPLQWDSPQSYAVEICTCKT